MALGRPPVVLDPGAGWGRTAPSRSGPSTRRRSPTGAPRAATARRWCRAWRERVSAASGDGRTYTLRVRQRPALHERPAGARERRGALDPACARGRAGGQAPVRRRRAHIERRRHAHGRAGAAPPRPLVPARAGRGAGRGGAGEHPDAGGRAPGRPRASARTASSRRDPGARFVLIAQPRLQPAERPGRPARPIVVVTSGGTPAEQTDGVAADRLDVMITPPPADRLPELRSELRERYSEHPDLDTMYLALRSRGAAFGKPKLREALARALDKPEAARRLGGLVRTTCNVLPPLLPGLPGARLVPVGRPRRAPRPRAGTRARRGGGRGGPAGGRVGLARRRRPWHGSTWPRSGRSGCSPRGSLAAAPTCACSRLARRCRTRRASGPARRPGAAGGGRRDCGSPPTSWPA